MRAALLEVALALIRSVPCAVRLIFSLKLTDSEAPGLRSPIVLQPGTAVALLADRHTFTLEATAPPVFATLVRTRIDRPALARLGAESFVILSFGARGT